MNYSNSDIIQSSVYKNNKRYSYARLKDNKFGLVHKRLFSFLFEDKFVLTLDGYVDLPLIYDTEEEALVFVKPKKVEI